jgi:hypothetical protein
MIKPTTSGDFTRSAAFIAASEKAQAAFAALNETDAVHAAKISRLEDHHASLTEAIAELQRRLDKMEQGSIKARFSKCISRIRQGFRN